VHEKPLLSSLGLVFVLANTDLGRFEGPRSAGTNPCCANSLREANLW
jgi:hypothetical protein